MPRPKTTPIRKVISFDKAMLDAIDNYRRGQPHMPNATEAIRDLLAEALRARGYME